MLDRTLAGVDAVSRGGAVLAALMVVLLAGLIIAEIVASSLLGTELEFAFEYGTYLLVLMIFAGAADALRTGGHIRVSLLLDRTPPRIRAVLEIFATMLALAVVVFIGYAVSDMAVRSFIAGSRSYTPLETPLGYPQTLLAACAWLFAAQLAARLARCLIGAPLESGEADDVVDDFPTDRT